MSSAANTPTTYYLDSPDVKKHCAKNFEKIEKECGPEDQSDRKGKGKIRPSIRKLLGKKYKDKGYGQTLSKGGTDNHSWMADHCDFLWIPPGPSSHEEFLKKLDSLKGDLAEAVEGQLTKIVDAAKEKLKQEALDLAKKKAEQGAVRLGARWAVGSGGAVVGGVGAIVTEGIATVWNLWDMASTGYQVATSGYDAYKELGQLDDILKDYGKIGDELERLGKQARNDPQKAVADFMMAAAKLNPCVRARRCSLVPYGKTDSLTGHGCCPGQTGHHLIPDSAVKDSGCTGYNYKEAPTVCAEGTGNSHGGSHQMLHDGLEKRLRGYIEREQSNKISYEKYRNHAIMTFYQTFPESKCNKDCLKAQLDAHYKCSNDLSAASGKGGGPNRTSGANTD
ncbi:HNH/endonuclease VII fold toxin-2 domain-containing protein [Ralstonia solanacearum]|uniref:HNH/endonuclease VII fold toxin-2 domain-containing protein n=1 Tax=Ralstonia solanacearum TaxID=305 RepID=UPI0005ABE43A|nr:HNH/endonuclease VII fold toxin-2 domain-containing protein [Ralstonia solanacearum]